MPAAYDTGQSDDLLARLDEPETRRRRCKQKAASAAAIVVAPTIVGNLALTMWYLVRPQANASRTGIAARVYGRIAP